MRYSIILLIVGNSCGVSIQRGKVENILKGSMDLIPSPSPSVKIQIMGGKVCWRCKGKTLMGVVNKLLKTNKSSNFLPHYPCKISRS